MRIVAKLFEQLRKRQFENQRTATNALPDNLYRIKPVKIAEGKSKYLLVKVYNHGETGLGKPVVRAEAKAHATVYDNLKKECQKYQLCTKIISAGSLNHTKELKSIVLTGKSRTFRGLLNHEYTKEILKREFPEYKILIIDPDKIKT